MLENIYTTKMSAESKVLQKRFSKIRSASGRASKVMASVMTVFMTVTFVCATIVMAALDNEEAAEPIILYSNGESIELENKPFIQNNMTYFPLREVFEKLGVFENEGNELVWDNGTIYIKVAEATVNPAVSYTIKIGSDAIDIKHGKDTRVAVNPAVMTVKLYMPGEAPLLIGDKTYVPYTFIDYMLNRGLGLRNRTDVFDFMFTINGKAAFISQGLVWPCDGEISNRFGERKNPVTNDVIRHNGIDIAALEGTDVKAAVSGTVTETGYDAEKGCFVVIERDNIKTVYCNLMQEMQVEKGDKVSRGQNIGRVGQTGMSTGAHLHFEVLINNRHFDPELIS